MQKALVMAGLVLLTALAFAAPSASADYCDAIMQDPPQACHAAVGAAGPVLAYALCYYNTAPSQWANCI